VADTTIPEAGQPFVDEKGMMTIPVSIFINIIGNLTIAEGVGSPEGVLFALVTKQYMDTSGTAGNISYIKRDADIAGDKTKGWILV